MPFISVTRLRLRSVRFFPAFAWHAFRSSMQLRKAGGYLQGSVLPDRRLVFWTMSLWDAEESMRSYMVHGAHKQAMTRLMHWCDEASVTHWLQDGEALPAWTEADRRMRTKGRASKVRHPSPGHFTLAYRAPRLWGAAPLPPPERVEA